MFLGNLEEMDLIYPWSIVKSIVLNKVKNL